MLISKDQLRACMPYATAQNIEAYLKPLNDTCELFGVNTPKRIAAFLAQLAHESGSLRYSTELASGEAYDVGKLAVALGNTPEDDGDGEKYKGRGLIQITGKTNYTAVGKALGVDLLTYPALLCRPDLAAKSAGWYWDSRGLNKHADVEDFKTITKKINGGYNGYIDRIKHWLRARKIFGLPDLKVTLEEFAQK
jgi:putative chitinase